MNDPFFDPNCRAGENTVTLIKEKRNRFLVAERAEALAEETKPKLNSKTIKDKMSYTPTKGRAELLVQKPEES